MKSDRSLVRLDRNGPILVTLGILVLALAYLYDAYSGSARIHNLIMLVPMTLLVVVLCVIIFLKEFTGPAISVSNDGREASSETSQGSIPALTLETGMGGASAGAVASMMAALLVYAGLTPWIGFDLTSVAFMIFCLWVQGEKRPIVLVGFSVVYAFGVTWLLVHAAQVAAPTLFMGGTPIWK
jgi:hypothetical protein